MIRNLTALEKILPVCHENLSDLFQGMCLWYWNAPIISQHFLFPNSNTGNEINDPQDTYIYLIYIIL